MIGRRRQSTAPARDFEADLAAKEAKLQKVARERDDALTLVRELQEEAAKPKGLIAARAKGQLLQLLREWDGLALHAPNVKPPEGSAWAFGEYYGPSIFETPHDPWLHDEGKPCPHCRGSTILTEIRLLVEGL